jgi:hypothetical protein
MKASLPFVNKFTNGYQKLRREHGPGKKSKKDAILELQNLIEIGISTSWSNTKQPSAWINMTFFRHHIQNIAITAAPLFRLTRQDSGYLSDPLPDTPDSTVQTTGTRFS